MISRNSQTSLCHISSVSPTPFFVLSNSKTHIFSGPSRSGGAASNLTGTFIAHALSTNALQQHIKTQLIPYYAHRYRTIMAAITQHLAPHGVDVPFALTPAGRSSASTAYVAGGYFIYVRLPASVSAERLTQRALDEQNVILAPESMCRVPPPRPGAYDAGRDQFVRLCFAWEDEEVLVEGVRRVGKVLGDMVREGGDVTVGEGEATSAREMDRFS